MRVIVGAFRWLASTRAYVYSPRELGTASARSGISPVDLLDAFAEVQKSFVPVSILRRIVEEGTRGAIP